MSLSTGTRLGPYEIQSALGAGGMGEVYKARDTRLDRTVAIKILHTQTGADRSARERLAREARAISSLTHPHICTLYDLGTQDGIDFLVMEYVEGQTLAARLAKGPLPIDQALTCAMQTASALDRAHSAGIVHRDIKPANVMLTRGGVKLLDFGLAKTPAPLVGPDGRTQGASDLTQPGLIVGTVQYMAPEQVDGRPVDARTDLFAFGALLYEMVSGRKAFDADSAATLIAAILERDPPRLSSVQPLAPLALDRIVATCLKKNPDDRWQTARDLLRTLELTNHLDTNAPRSAAAAVVPPRRWWIGTALATAVAGALLILAIGIAMDRNWRSAATTPLRDVRFSIYPEYGSAFVTAPASVVAPQLALSPDGKLLAFVATTGGRPMLWVRPLQALQARVLAGTEDAASPFWSSDSGSLGFFSQGRVKTISLAGGAPLVRTGASRDPRGATWAPDGTILATLMSQDGVMSVSKQGAVESAVAVNRTIGESNHRWPSLLPDGRHYLYVTRGSDASRRGVFLAARGESGATRLVDSDHGAAVADGRLLFVRGRALMAQPLDVTNRRLTGDAVAILDEVGIDTTGYTAFSASETGVLAYARTWPAEGELMWFARDGRRIGSPVAPLADYVSFSLSSDAARVAISVVDPQTATPDIWVLDLTRGSRERLTFDPAVDANAFWSPDGSRILFRSSRTGQDRVYVKRVNASASEELLESRTEEDMGSSIITDYSRDGAHVLLTIFGSATSFDVWRTSAANPSDTSAVVRTEFDEHHAVLSPNSRWLAYVSNETGAPQVYVQSFPDGGRRWQISSQGGSEPQWRRDGQELFFLAMDQTLMAVPISIQFGFKPGLPSPLFRVRVPLWGNPYRQQYAVSPDGQRFLVNTAPPTTSPPAIHVVLDWRVLLDRGAR